MTHSEDIGGLSAWGARALGFDARCTCCHDEGSHDNNGRCQVYFDLGAKGRCSCNQFTHVSNEPTFDELGLEEHNARCVGCRPASSRLYVIPISCWKPREGTGNPADAQRHPPGCPDPEFCRGNGCHWRCQDRDEEFG